MTYVGHSQGTSSMFYALASQPNYWNSKINLMVSLAPVTSLRHTTSGLIQILSRLTGEVRAAANLFHLYALFDGVGIVAFITTLFCGKVPSVCKELQIFVTTHDPKMDDSDRFGVYMGHFPQSTSTQGFYHYGQEVLNSNSDMPLYNWGSKKSNQLHYGQDHPPIVDFSKINVPLAMFVAHSDELGDVQDNQLTKAKLNSKYLVHYEEILGGHTTFMIGKDTSYIQRMIGLIDEHSGK